MVGSWSFSHFSSSSVFIVSRIQIIICCVWCCFLLQIYLSFLKLLVFFLFLEIKQEVEEEVLRWEGYADWRNKAAVKGRHGGMLAASFTLGQCQNSNSNPPFFPSLWTLMDHVNWQVCLPLFVVISGGDIRESSVSGECK